MKPIISFMLVLLAGCTGTLPPNGTLPVINGANVSSVDAAKVAGMPAASVAQAAVAANAATDAGTAGTIIKRDAAGNFAANKITAALVGNADSATTSAYAAYADGKSGGTVTASATLQISTTGDFFIVSGNTAISALTATGRTVGARVTLRFSDTPTLTHSGSLLLTGGVSRIVNSGDTIQFVLLANEVWAEIGRRSTLDTDLSYAAASQTISAGATAAARINYTARGYDTLEEYNGSTFQAKQAGIYIVAASFLTTITAAGYCQIEIIATTSAFAALEQSPGSGAGLNYCNVKLTAPVKLAVGETIYIRGYTSIGNGGIVAGAFSFLRISRIGTQ